MPIRDPRKPRTLAQQEGDKAFKTDEPRQKRLTDQQEVEKAFDENRERLKAQRLAREAAAKKL